MLIINNRKMKEKIIALLTAKFTGVRKDTLAQLARTLAMQATTEEEAQALVDAITAEQVTEYERDYRAEVDREVTAGQKAHEGTLRKKFNLIEKKKEDDPPKRDPSKTDPPKADPTKNPDNNEAPEWAKDLLSSVKKLTEDVNTIKHTDTRNVRKQILEKAIENASGKVRAKVLKDFEVMNFTTEEDFNTYVETTKTDVAEIMQEFADQGLSSTVTPIKPGGQPIKEASEKECDAIVEKLNL